MPVSVSAPVASVGLVLLLLGAAVLGPSGIRGPDRPVPSEVPAPVAGAGLVDPPDGTSHAEGPGTAAARVHYTWPTGDPAPVRRAFDGPAVPWAAGHRGADLDLAPGAPVRAAGSGVVAFAGAVAGRPVVSVQHPDGIRTTYEPVVAVVVAGEPVGSGQVVGHLAGVGGHCAPATCLHWGARSGPREYRDPLALLRPPMIRLYPAG